VLEVVRDIGAAKGSILYSHPESLTRPPTRGSPPRRRDAAHRRASGPPASDRPGGREPLRATLNTGAQAVAFAQRVALPNVKVHLDTYHMNIEEADLESALIDTGAMLGYFHIGESGRGYLGAGNIDFDRVFRGLAKSGYEGPITFESFSSAVVNPQLQGILAIWRNLWEDDADLARHAKGFIESGVKAASAGERRWEHGSCSWSGGVGAALAVLACRRSG
jgi:D-psicose/D-tagatose/L-ribulose 3-epimerase